jgi:hypothetical protein
MNEIHDIVTTIVKGCARGGIEVSDILAAFTAQTVNTFFVFHAEVYDDNLM